MSKRRAVALALVALIATAGVAAATHTSQGLSSALQARGAWDRSERTAFLSALAAQGKAATSEVATFRVTVAANGYTNWHGHPGPSVVTVTSGQVTVLEPTANGGCRTETYGPGAAFFHSMKNHDFRNLGSQPAEMWITYFVTEWPPLIHHDDPGTCG